ncbi:HxlR family transcriptional regulator [Amycolatopsis mediterranei S699]|uniref:HxlR family transcriptional regulator n=2 Tax=Amycolatopsis mediterranei TaxID=33910 RepID=A0A0H3DCC4_AMYMU|nr:winged helix-turn-helix transcriptional regulator [Amycolatopsis mediterranei]ADJ48610.1 HxlR family transcriptional regulator [Amycolatopsis mediterranei U32]AEK45543.1 HxlR family transcriptional regulator [Amycolatopsis mediterranei S699]AFO80319.1 HxlR family transcriptional regulator [Amycolatopsis mediterranei S699]AGT87447.1 HxlR family transcriptional regulator [Amycolatopsis mediterranei RB]KDO11219.1 HxlR family transcriptional regulator [Amycolatopsis mediterranei]
MPTSARTYGQFCGLARALEIVGERWSLLVVRDLMLGPKRFDDLQHTLPRIPVSILTSRLNELEEAGVVRRRVLSQLDAGVVYELTEYGTELDHIVLDLGLWGSRSLTYPRPDEVFTLDTAIISLYTTFQEEAAAGVHVNYELHHPGDMIVHAMVDDGALKASAGALPAADLVIEPQGPAVLDLLNGSLTAQDAISSGKVRVQGDPAHLDLFTRLFRIPPAPERPTGLVAR